MLNSFSPERGSDVAHSLFGSIVGLFKFFLLLVPSFEVVVFATMIWAARSSWLRRSEIFPPRASTPGGVFRSPLSPAVSSQLFFSCVPFCSFLTVSHFLPLVGGSGRHPPFTHGGHCTCRWNNAPSSWFRDKPFWPFANEVVGGPTPLLGLLPFLVAKRGRGRRLVVSISWWIVGTSLTLLFCRDGLGINWPCSPSRSSRRVPPLFLGSLSILG